MPNQIQYIPVTEIDEEVLFRRFPSSQLQDGTFNGVCAGKVLHVFELSRPSRRYRYGLICGQAPFPANRHTKPGTSGHKPNRIAAVVHDSYSVPNVLREAIETAEAAGKLAPMELGRLVHAACDQGLFPTHDDAVASLFPGANARRRCNIRKFAQFHDLVDGVIAKPEALNQTQILRLEAAFRKGFGTRIRTLLQESGATQPREQWEALLPILAEAEQKAA